MTLPSRKTMLSLLAALCLLLALLWLALRPTAQLASTQAAFHGPLTHSFMEEGKTRIRQRYLIAAPVAGQLQRITLEPGDAVSAGQVLAEVVPATSSLLDARSRAQAEAEARAGQSREAAARQRVRAAEATHALAAGTLQRFQALSASGGIAAAAVDQARAEAASTQARLAAARAEETAAGQQAAASRAALAQEGRTRTRGALAVSAPVDGVVLRRVLQSSTPVAAGQALLEIGDARDLEIEAEVLSTDAVRLRPGMQANVLRWGGEGVLSARIRRIEPAGFTKVSALGVEEQRTRVILDITSAPENWASLGDAYRVELEFILAHAENALQVPAGALFRSGDASGGETWALYRVEGGRARHTRVKTGLRSGTAVEILEGVKAGEAVIVQPDDRIRDGSRIRAH